VPLKASASRAKPCFGRRRQHGLRHQNVRPAGKAVANNGGKLALQFAQHDAARASGRAQASLQAVDLQPQIAGRDLVPRDYALVEIGLHAS